MGQDKREIPRQGSNIMQTPEKVLHTDFGNSRPSPTAEKLSNILNNGPQNNYAAGYDLNQNKVGNGISNFNAGSRDGSLGNRSVGNMSHGSVGSMNVSAGGYGSDASGKGRESDASLGT